MAGTASLAGCSGINGASNESPSTTNSTGKNNDTTTDNDGKETTTENGTDPNQSSPQTYEEFEKLDSWSIIEGQGVLKKSTQLKYQGSQSAHVVGSKQTKEGQIHRVDFSSNPADFSNKNLSLAFRCTSHNLAKIEVQLYAPDRGHVVSLKRTLYGPKGKWVRVNLGVTGVQRPKTVDLSKIYEIRIIGRPVDSNSAKPINFYVDDLKTVSTPKKGKVMLTFDDGLANHYETVFPLLKKYDFAGVDGIITEAVYDDGFLTQNQMREMVQDGWDMISHPNTQATPMNKRSMEEQEKLMKQSQSWLKKYGYDGYKYMAVPKNVVGPKTFDLAKKYFDVTMTFGGSPNALPSIQKDTILSRMYGQNVQATKQAIDYAAQYKQLTILLFHRIGGKEISEKDFKSILEYIRAKNVDVITLTDLQESNLLI